MAFVNIYKEMMDFVLRECSSDWENTWLKTMTSREIISFEVILEFKSLHSHFSSFALSSESAAITYLVLLLFQNQFPDKI